MKALNARSEIRAQRAAFLASDRAPFKQLDGRRKLIENQRARGFPNLNYQGGPTVPQKMLFDVLPGAVMEFKLPGSGKTSPLSIDIAIPSLKLAIEVDGLSHAKRKEKARDGKKEQILKELGWTLLRFWNREIASDFPSVLVRIEATIAMLQGAA